MDDAALAREISGSDAVINLIGILHESSKLSFDAIHHQLPGRLVHICREQGVGRLLHMSALQAAKDAPSAYLRSKGEGQAVVMAAQSEQFHVSVFRPSVIFGRGDSFINLFANLVKLSLVVPLPKPAARFQPVFVEDVARAFVTSLENIDTYGQHYDLCGPQVYSLRELVQYVADTLGLKRRIIGLNDRLSCLQAYMMELFMKLLPLKLMTRDNLKSMEIDSVCGCPFPPIFGLQPTAMEVVVPDYLRGDTPRYAYKRFRGAASH
jgi:NADH dehydrogenase